MTRTRIVVVEDEVLVLRSVTRLLSRRNWDVLGVTSAEEALEALKTGDLPQILLADYMLPGMDGISLLVQVKERWPTIHGILMTGHADVSSLQEAINRAKVYRFLRKPWAPDELQATLQAALEHWQAEEANRRLQSLLTHQNRVLQEARDHLELKVAERTRLLSKITREWTVVFDALEDPVMFIDGEYRILRGNRALARNLDTRVKALPGRHCYDVRQQARAAFSRDESGPCRGCPVASARATGHPASAEIRAHDERLFSVDAFPVTENEGGSVVCVYRDLTEKRAVEQQLAQADKLAAIGLMASGIAHEINSPLGAIITFVQLLQRGGLSSEDNSTYLKEIEASARRCKEIVSRLLKVARSERRTTFHPVNLNDLANDTTFLIENAYLDKNVYLSRELDPDLPCVLGSATELSQVLLNLVSNAWDALAEGGRILVRTRRLEDGNVELTVADNGDGIPPESLPHIFEPFYTTKAPGQGTGLGLSICYRIVQEHRGRIEVVSRPGAGTTFRVTFPSAERVAEA